MSESTECNYNSPEEIKKELVEIIVIRTLIYDKILFNF